MAHDVFISYSSKDKPIADAACAYLERESIRCWIAPRDIRPGQNYGAAIVEGLNACDILVIIFSGNSNNSVHVVKEVERAVSKESVVVPFRVEDVVPSAAMEYFLSSEHWLDAITKPMDSHLQKLVHTIKVLMDAEETNRQETPRPSKQIDPNVADEFEEFAPSDWYRSGKSNKFMDLIRGLFAER